jgi:hypothetical protein
MTRAFNEDALWKGRIQRANYPPLGQPKVLDLPKFNTLTGRSEHLNRAVFEEVCVKSAQISRDYWAGERVRREAYRAARLKSCEN